MTNNSSYTPVDVDKVLLEVDSAPISEIWDCITGIVIGDFNKDQTIEQIIGITAVSMVPIVDQACDIRDVVANIYHLSGDIKNTEHWLALGLTLAGIVPTLGSFGKGGAKVALHYAKKGGNNAVKILLGGNKEAIEKAFGPLLDAGIDGLIDLAQRPTVKKFLTDNDIYETFQVLAKELEVLSKEISPSKLYKILEGNINQIRGLYDAVPGWMKNFVYKKKVEDFFKLCDRILLEAKSQLEKVFNGIQELILLLAKKLKTRTKIVDDATVNTKNPHQVDGNNGKKSGNKKDKKPKPKIVPRPILKVDAQNRHVEDKKAYEKYYEIVKKKRRR